MSRAEGTVAQRRGCQPVLFPPNPTSICLMRPLSSSVHHPCAVAASLSRAPSEPKKEMDGKIQSAGSAATALSNYEAHCCLPTCEGSAEIRVVRTTRLRFPWFNEPVVLSISSAHTGYVIRNFFVWHQDSSELGEWCSEVTIFSVSPTHP